MKFSLLLPAIWLPIVCLAQPHGQSISTQPFTRRSSQLTTKEEVLRMYQITGSMLSDLEKELKSFPWHGGQVAPDRVQNAVHMHAEIARRFKESIPTITAGGMYVFSSALLGQPKENFDWMPTYTILLIHVLDRMEDQKQAIIAAGQRDTLVIALRDLKDVTTTWREEVRKKLTMFNGDWLQDERTQLAAIEAAIQAFKY